MVPTAVVTVVKIINNHLVVVIVIVAGVIIVGVVVGGALVIGVFSLVFVRNCVTGLHRLVHVWVMLIVVMNNVNNRKPWTSVGKVFTINTASNIVKVTRGCTWNAVNPGLKQIVMRRISVWSRS
jgi:hypothetical protein